MADTTTIGWTDHTHNPWWGCTKIEAPGDEPSACDNCYAATLANRYGHNVWGKDADRRALSDANWRKPLQWERQAVEDGHPHLVFCASMGDVFEHRDDLDPMRDRLWELIEATPHLIWQLLTKRPERVPSMVPREWLGGGWPANAWLGVTVESEPFARIRIPRLLAVPAPLLFLSIEPLLGAIDLRPWLRRISDEAAAASEFEWDTSRRIGWVICGGESGAHHRPLDLVAARAIRDECATWDVPFFFKQVGGRTPTAGGDELDGVVHKAFPPEACRG